SNNKSSNSSPEKDDELTQKLCDLALDLAEQEDSDEMSDALRQQESEFNKLIKRSIFQKKDELLYEALERAKYADIGAYQLLKERIEETSEVIVTARDDGKNVEINVFVIPMFIYTIGGLQFEDCFEDQEAFELLSKSLQDGGLESPDASVVLVNHAYHLDEIDAITFSHLNDMVRDAHAAITDLRGAATPAIDRSFGPWPEGQFGPEDQAVELRFLLGFALKTTDDAFYRIPQDEAEMEAYFEARAERFERWTENIVPVVKRCLVAEGTEIDVNFLYQDLFHGGKDRAIAEYFMLQMMSELNHRLDQHGIDVAHTKAIIGPTEVRNEMVLRVNLYTSADDALIASSEKPWNLGRDLEDEIADVQDALATIGVTSLAIAAQFDAEGLALDVRAV
ncbi:MAG TPA: DUF2863 family protein, partial [Burkholderiaceae bacterium]|nr:DUF2863 family protein [Burkholderiaceae bacterium]